MSFLSEYYLVIKSLHIISVISWMAGMLYLPRLFVYHAQVEPTSDSSDMLKVMERKLLRYIINPAMIASLIFGILLIIITDALHSGGWMHAKIGVLVILFAVHGMLARYRKDFLHNKNRYSAKFYRMINEVPTLAMIIIVFLVVMKPF